MRQMRPFPGLVTASVLLVSLFATTPARAETGRWNLHLNPGVVAFPPVGFLCDVGADWQFARGFALDFRLGGGFLADTIYDPIANDETTELAGVLTASMGVRFRFVDDGSGYLNEPGGRIAGDFWLAPHMTFFLASMSPGMLFDVEVGYEMSVVRPMSIGVFAKPSVGFTAAGGFVVVLTAGLSFSFEFQPMRLSDADHDGVVDERDACPGTAAGAPVDRRGCELDTDGDGVVDRLDQCPGTPPGAQVDERGCELDDDGDGVVNSRDECPGTPPGSEVDARGCVVMQEQLVLDGIEFAYDSAEINPDSVSVLRVAAQMLLDNPEVRVEIGGHTDDQGAAAYNLELSRDRAGAVAQWLVAHGVERSRLEVRGYGRTRPRVPNTSEENRAQNRRIEFVQIQEE